MSIDADGVVSRVNGLTNLGYMRSVEQDLAIDDEAFGSSSGAKTRLRYELLQSQSHVEEKVRPRVWSCADPEHDRLLSIIRVSSKAQRVRNVSKHYALNPYRRMLVNYDVVT